MKSSLFILAHQDDEIAVASRIAFELARGKRVQCAFLTDGGKHREVREAESLRVLSALGLDRGDIHFVGRDIADGHLVEQLDAAFESLTSSIDATKIDVIFTLAREGGHYDHDATHLVALAYAAAYHLPCFEMPIYHGAQLPGPFFRVMSPLGSGWTARKLSVREGLRFVSLIRNYRTQRISWLGLAPGAFMKLVVQRREFVREAKPEDCCVRPHAGSLFYERRFGDRYELFASLAEPFIEQKIIRC